MNLYETHPLVVIPLQIVLTLVVVLYLVSFFSGWRSLSEYYRTDRPMPTGSFTSSGQFRFLMRYNNALRLGSDAEGLYLGFWPRLAHPPLFIPWSEIEVRPARRVLFFPMQTLVLGRDLQIPFTTRQRDADRLLSRAGGAKVEG